MHYEKYADGTVKCIEDEIPFDVPDGWEWARLGSIAEADLGKMLDAAKNKGLPRPYLRNINVRWGVFDLTDLLTMRIQDEEVERYSVQKGDLVVCEGGEPGRCAIWEAENGVFFQKALHRVRPHLVSSEYVFLVIYALSLSGFTERYFTGTTIKHLTGQAIKALLIPIPPIHEQERICDAAKKALGIVDDIEENNEALVSTLSLAKAHILELAIRGLLVPQNPDDEPASVLLDCIRAEKEKFINQGKIKRDKRESVIFRGDDNSYYERFRDGTIICVDNEILFELPDGWEWERLSNIAWFSGGKTPSMSHAEYWNGSIPWITSKDMKTKYLTTSMVKMTEEGATTQQLYTPGTVLVVVRSGILRHTLPVAILNTEATINQDIKAIELVDKRLSEYVYICLKALENHILLKYTKAGTTVENINFDEFTRVMLPIPPVAEMHRIIDRLFQTDILIASISEYTM